MISYQHKTNTNINQDEYAALLNALEWSDGFGLLFAHCSYTEQISELGINILRDMPDKNIESLDATSPTSRLYHIVLSDKKLPKADIVLIKISDAVAGDLIQEGYDSSSKTIAPPLFISSLNLDRDGFRQSFRSTQFVFMSSKLMADWLIRRCPDFYDWQSGIFNF